MYKLWAGRYFKQVVYWLKRYQIAPQFRTHHRAPHDPLSLGKIHKAAPYKLLRL